MFKGSNEFHYGSSFMSQKQAVNQVLVSPLKRAGLSLILGLWCSVALAIAFGPWDFPRDMALFGFILFCGSFLSIMIFTFLRNRLTASDAENGPLAQSSGMLTSYARIRFVLAILFTAGIGFPTLIRVLAPYQPWCLDIPYIEFSIGSAIFDAIAAVIPIIPIIALHWLCRSGRVGDVVTLSTGLLYVAIAGYITAYGTRSHYITCSLVFGPGFLLLLPGLLTLVGWMVLYGIAAVIDAWTAESAVRRRQREISDMAEQPK